MARHVLLCVIAAGLVLSCGGCGTESPPGPVATFGTVSGHVYLVGTSQPISGVLVDCDGKSFTTGQNGYYHLAEIEEGTRTLTAEKSDYEPYSESINVDGDITHDIYMTSSTSTTNLWGYVSHRIDGPLQGVLVQVAGLQDWTDANGHYQLPNVPQGVHTISFSRNGYNSFSDQVYLYSSDKRYDAFLTKNTAVQLAVASDSHTNYWILYGGQVVPDPANHGGEEYLLVEHVWNISGDQEIKDIYLALPTVSPPYAWASLVSATLTLNSYQSNYNLAVDLQMYEVTGAWSEGTISGDSYPPHAPNYYTTAHVESMFTGALDIDVSLPYQRIWAGQSQYGVMVHSPQSYIVAFSSSEYGNFQERPRVTVTYSY